MRLHFENNAAFTHVTKLVREIEARTNSCRFGFTQGGRSCVRENPKGAHSYKVDPWTLSWSRCRFLSGGPGRRCIYTSRSCAWARMRCATPANRQAA
eukprot:4247757-Pyramimonas_sp.AAC.1